VFSRVQTKARNFCVLGAFGRKLAAVQEKFAGRHPTKVWRRRLRQFLLQLAKSLIHFVALSPVWGPRTSACPGARTSQGQMRAETSLLLGNAYCCKRFFYFCRQVRQASFTFDSQPEYTRGFRRRKKSGTMESHLKRLSIDRTKRFFNLLHSRLWFFADKLYRHVERLWTNPPCPRRKPAHLIHEML